MQGVYPVTRGEGVGVEQFGGDGLAQRVVAFFLVSGNKIVAFFCNHAVQPRYLVRAVLKVCVHCDNHLAAAHAETGVERRTFAVVAAERRAAHMCRIFGGKILNNFPRTVGRAVVDKYHLIGEFVFLHHALNPGVKLGQRFFLII